MVQTLLWVHVLGAALVLGGVVAGWVCMNQAAIVGDAKVTLFALKAMRRLNTWTLHLGSALVLMSGFWMALAGPVPLKLSANPWLLYSVILYFVILFLVTGAQSPISKKVMALAEKDGPDFGVIFSRIVGHWKMLSGINVFLLAVILFLMVFKP
ncbi:MAG: DUF2269 domain-containing protein [Acidobacteriia bacterium]|nr:DUF2269 domain-containing protein [Terriglobia bacterium]